MAKSGVNGLDLALLSYIPFARSLGIDYLYTAPLAVDPSSERKLFVAKASLQMLIFVLAVTAVHAYVHGSTEWTAYGVRVRVPVEAITQVTIIGVLLVVSFLWTIARTLKLYSLLGEDKVSNAAAARRLFQVGGVYTVVQVAAFLSVVPSIIVWANSLSAPR